MYSLGKSEKNRRDPVETVQVEKREGRAKRGKSRGGKKPQWGGARQHDRGALWSGKAELYAYVKKEWTQVELTKLFHLFTPRQKNKRKTLVRQFPVVASRGYRESRMV